MHLVSASPPLDDSVDTTRFVVTSSSLGRADALNAYGIFKNYIKQLRVQRRTGPWSSGYDVSLTRRGSPVRVRLGPPYFYKYSDDELIRVPLYTQENRTSHSSNIFVINKE